MTDELSAFWSGFRSSSASGKTRAIANPVNNSLRINTPADKKQEMAVQAVFISREEFLHGQWDVAILNSVAHLALAADEALIACVESEEPAGSMGWYLDRLNECRTALGEILTPMGPFVEAVDKFQLLSVIDEGFKSDIEETFEVESLQDDQEISFRATFDEILQKEIDRAKGHELPKSGDYVNPYYVHALSDIATTYGASQADAADPDAETPASTQGRTIAEVVARATLDVPQPIEPLGTNSDELFGPLRTPDGLPDPLPLSELTSESERYSITKEQFDRYLGGYPKPGSASEVSASADDDDADLEIDMEYRFDDARADWVARSFINVRKELDTLASDEETELLTIEAEDIDLATVDADVLRRELVARVHGQQSGSMREYPTALLDIPQQAEIPQQDEDLMSAPGEPLAKVLLESFEQHGSFGSVVYNLGADEIGFELNWHATRRPFDPTGYHHVPDGINEYGALWRYFYFYEGLHGHLHRSRMEYREPLEVALKDAFDDVESLKESLKDARIRLQERRKLSQPSAASLNQSTNYGAAFQSLSHAERLDSTRTSQSVEGRLKPQPLEVLYTLAAEEGVLPVLTPDESDCPLCEIHTGTCGPQDECEFAAELQRFNANQADFIRHLLS